MSQNLEPRVTALEEKLEAIRKVLLGLSKGLRADDLTKTHPGQPNAWMQRPHNVAPDLRRIDTVLYSLGEELYELDALLSSSTPSTFLSKPRCPPWC